MRRQVGLIGAALVAVLLVATGAAWACGFRDNMCNRCCVRRSVSCCQLQPSCCQPTCCRPTVCEPGAGVPKEAPALPEAPEAPKAAALQPSAPPPPAEKPAEKPAKKAVTKSAEKPAEEPAKLPSLPPGTETPAVKPAEKPIQQPVDKPAEKAAEKPAEEPGRLPALPPAGEEPGAKPADKPAEKPADKPADVPLSSTLNAVRLWTDGSGKYQVEAMFVSVRDGVVNLEKSDGRFVHVDLARLSSADQQFVRRQLGTVSVLP